MRHIDNVKLVFLVDRDRAGLLQLARRQPPPPPNLVEFACRGGVFFASGNKAQDDDKNQQVGRVQRTIRLRAAVDALHAP
jgi:hypothetical protein